MILILFLTFGLNSQKEIKEITNECPENCESCKYNDNNNLECSICSYKYGFEAGTKNCKPCTDIYCEDCRTDNTICERCISGYGVNKKSNKCQKCSIEGCSSCGSDYTECSSCSYGYILVNKENIRTCEKCPEHCKSCSDADHCNSCFDGYTLAINDDGTPTSQCTRCPNFCRDCNSPDSCNYCQSFAYSNSDGKCSLCPNNAYCYSNQFNCYSGYGPLKDDDGNFIGCAPCPLHCDSCSENSEICDYCENGFGPVLENNKKTGKCQKCTGLCSDCSDDYTICKKCKGYSGPEIKNGKNTGNCIQCSPGCRDCSDDYTVCKECNYYSGYRAVLDEDKKPTGKCELCPSFCEYCTSDPKECIECQSGFGLVNNECKPCPSNCLYCDGNAETCTECFSGYGLVSDGKGHKICKPCPLNCYSCDDNNEICTECKSNYIGITDKQGTIISCVRGSISCENGYGPVLDDKNIPTGECKKCMEGCKSCDINYKICNQCDNGYGFDLSNGESINCKKCPDNCNTCSQDYTECETCKRGFYKDNNNKCQKCNIDHCLDCYDQNSCRTCEDGYMYFYLISSCVKAIPNCISLGSSGCSQCKNGYAVSNGECVKCRDSNCLSCSLDSSFCDLCNEGFGIVLDDKGKSTGSCGPCSNNCEYCANDHTKCSICEEGYGFVRDSKGKLTNQCGKCPDNCYSCQYDSTKCSECKDGYGLVLDKDGVSTGECRQCSSSNCKYCNNDYSICSTCNDHFGVNKNGKCEKCPQNCEFCNKDSSFCAYCDDDDDDIIGQVVDGNGQFTGQCKACEDNCYCQASNICKGCNDGYGFAINSDGSNSGKCEKCMENCAYCYYNSKFCLYCDEGYGLEMDDNWQYTGKCTKCSDGCSYCNSIPLRSCDKCSDGFTFDIVDGKITNNCVSCPENCDKCIDKSKCIDCKSGYGLSDNGACTIKCSLNCKDCNENQCTRCEDGFNLVNGECYECLPNCKYCFNDYDNDNDVYYKICTNCREGYGIIYENDKSTGRCGKCKDNCEECYDNNDECELCAENYCLEEDENSNYYHMCIRCDVENLPPCNVENCFMCDSESPNTCVECIPTHDMDYTGKCIEKAKVLVRPKPIDVYAKIDKNRIENGNYEHVFEGDIDDTERLVLKLLPSISEITISNCGNKNIAIIMPEDVTQIKVNAADDCKGKYVIESQSNKYSVTLDSTDHSSLMNAAGTIEIQSGDGKDVNLNLVQPSSKYFQIIPKSKIIINEVEIIENDGAILVNSDDASKVEIKSMKIQQAMSGKISKVVVTGTILFGSSSSLEIDEFVNLEKATLDCSDYQTVSDKAHINGKIIKTTPSKILINHKELGQLLEDNKILIAEAEQFDDCENWGKRIDTKGFKNPKCEKGEDGIIRLYAYEKESNKLSPAAIAGIVIGVVAFVGIVVFLCVYFLVIKKKKNISSVNEAEDNDNDANEV